MSDPGFQLIIGTKNLSSWSLRPWLVMTRMGLAFDEIKIDLNSPHREQLILPHSPSGKVPALKIGSLVIWDSLAILSYLTQIYPNAALWPDDSDAHAIACSAAAEMHAGFGALRAHCPMDFTARKPMNELPPAVEKDVRRIVELWIDCRRRYGRSGPFLFGEFSCADAMYAPVASRFRTYLPDLGKYGDDGTAASYVDTIFAMPEIQAWADDAANETDGKVTPLPKRL